MLCRTVRCDCYHLPLPWVISDLPIWDRLTFHCVSTFPWGFGILILGYPVDLCCKAGTCQPGRIPFLLMNGPEGLVKLYMELRADVSCMDI